MVDEIIHTAIARKMLCSPVNSLIADTEFACAAGVALRLLHAKEEIVREAETLADIGSLKTWLLDRYEEKFSENLDIPFQNLTKMIRNYHAQEELFDEKLKRLFLLGYEQELVYPKGKFL